MQPKLSPTILTTMSTTLTQPTIAVQTMTVTPPTATTSGTSGTTITGTTVIPTPTQQITTAINKALRRNPGSGPGGPGGPGGPTGQAVNPLAIIPQAAHVCLMGSLPAIFSGNRAEAENFINGIQAYICLNREVPGFTSPMKKIALVLTLMQGEKVVDWANNMRQALDELDPATDNIPALWTTFLEEF